MKILETLKEVQGLTKQIPGCEDPDCLVCRANKVILTEFDQLIKLFEVAREDR